MAVIAVTSRCCMFIAVTIIMTVPVTIIMTVPVTIIMTVPVTIIMTVPVTIIMMFDVNDCVGWGIFNALRPLKGCDG
tara:strand:- start:1131 stop:1361 length:231 start_codon:yes stop_codon:yes gene_type:complete